MISTVPGETPPYKVSLDIGLDSRTDWSFGGGEYGGLGLQDRFVGDEGSLRSLGSSGSYTFSMLLPEAAVLRDASMEIVSPPSPEGIPSGTVGLGSFIPGGTDSFDAADLDGDGNLDIVYYDERSSSIMLLRDPFGSAISVVLETSITGPVHTRALDRDDAMAGTLVTSWVDATTSLRKLTMHIMRDDGGLLRIPLSSNLSVSSVGFSVREDPEGNDTVLYISGPGGHLYSAQVDRNGNVAKKLILDSTKGLTDPYMADLDGDMDLDMMLFGDIGSSPRAVMLESLSKDGQAGYSLMDINTTLGPEGLAAVCDANGDGKEEVYFVSDRDMQMGMVYFDISNGPLTRTLGIDASNASVRSVPHWDYGCGGAYNGGEGLLYITSPSGLFQVLPHTGPTGDYLSRRSPSIVGGSIITGLDGQSGSVFALDEEKGLIGQDLLWLWQQKASLTDMGSGRSIDVAVRSPVDAATEPLDILSVLGPGSPTHGLTDPSGNLLDRLDLSISGDTSFLKVTGLKVRYDIVFDASTSLELLPSMLRAQSDFNDMFIPLQISGTSEGSVEVGPVHLIHDAVPRFAADMPMVLSVDEDSLARTIMSLRDHVIDDELEPWELDLKLIMIGPTPDGLVFLDRNMNLVSHASAFPDLSGEFHFQLALSDTRSTVLSGQMTLVVQEVDDPPRVKDWPSSVLIEEGSEAVVPLMGENGCFWDPDGDMMSFSWDIISISPSDGSDHITLSLVGTSLVVGAEPTGRGCQFKLEVRADDGMRSTGQYTSVVLMVEVLDVDSPPYRIGGSGPLELSEDQSLPTKVDLGTLFHDPDDDPSDCTFRATSSDKRLLSYIGEDRTKPSLFVQPTREINGQHKIWIEMSSRGQTVTEELPVQIVPVNDLPVVVVDSRRDLAGKGWMITGHVEDPDDTGGLVQYMVADGQWKDAWGFNVWTFVMDFADLPPEGGFVFVRANDGTEDSTTIFIKLLPPDMVQPPPDGPDDDVPDDDDPGSIDPPFYIAPDDPKGGQGLLYLMFGATAGLLGMLLLTILLTEVGFVTILSAVMSAYSKLSKKDILNHEIRGLIRGYIIANPGDHYSSIKRNLDLNNGTLAYHLRVLEQNGLIKSMYDGIYKRYYPANVNISKLKKNISKQEEIFNIILENPGITMEQIGRNIGVSRQVVNYHVKNLIRAGSISYQRDDKSARFFSSENIAIPLDT
ncbi:MAG: winged helix-turn-helix transcriptional regulator [Candidatus Thermoplasmatota archaeon]|nr:winged helix-turn-helix transcriptional regulator [Candidatus Thermoplasmatota archaeon]